jgi:hypothetical protein
VPGPKERPCNPGSSGESAPNSGIFLVVPLGLAGWVRRRGVGGMVTRNVLRRHRPER